MHLHTLPKVCTGFKTQSHNINSEQRVTCWCYDAISLPSTTSHRRLLFPFSSRVTENGVYAFNERLKPP